MSSRKNPVLRGVRASSLLLVLLSAALLGAQSSAQSRRDTLRLTGHRPAAVQTARRVAAVAGQEPVELALSLPVRNQGELDGLLKHLYTPGDPQYGRYLSSEEFQARFSPTEAQYEAVARFARASGLTVTGTHANRLLLGVSGTAAAVERAFNTRLARYQALDGRVFRAPEEEPAVPAALSGTVSGVAGLSDFGGRRPHLVRRPARVESRAMSRSVGTGPGGGMTPSDIKIAYNLAGTALDGSGQVLALFELDGYNPTDITTYEDQFGLPHVPLQNILVDGVSGAAGDGADEVTLDIELQIAMAPRASKIMVYEGKNSDPGVLAAYNQIAVDNQAKSISTSWGLAEGLNSTATLRSEETIFKQMAAQGQSIFAASGDAGAYDDGRHLGVDDPASQPYMTGVGGTRLFTNGPGGSWQRETTWNDGSARDGGGGGGISSMWPIPDYQTGVVSTASKGSTTKRNVPDVSLNSTPDAGYAIFSQGDWVVFGGTSCAAPLWAGFTALVNQQRASLGSGPAGFMNPRLYALGRTKGATDFHDVADGSTNLFYAAVSGYDCATGWGTINGANLVADLSTDTPGSDGQGPELSNHSITPRSLPSSGGPVAVSVEVASTGTIRQVVVNLVSPSGGTTSRALSPVGSSATYAGSVIIPANSNVLAATYRLSVSATDSTGNTSSVDLGTVNVAERDIAPPTIVAGTVSPLTLPPAGGPVNVNVSVTDTSGVASVLAVMTRAGVSTSIPLSHDGSSGYVGTFSAPANTTASKWSYSVTLRATDSVGNMVNRNFGTITVSAADNKPPSITRGKVSPSALPAAGGTVTISATVTDSVGVTSVVATVTRPGGATDTVPLTASGRAFSATYAVPANSGTAAQKYTVTLTAADAAGNTKTVRCGVVTVRRP